MIWDESDPTKTKGKYSTYKDITRELESRGLGYEKWKTLDNHHNLSHDDIFKHYSAEIEKIMKKFNFKSNDIISITPSNPKNNETLHEYWQFVIFYFADNVRIISIN